MSLLRNHILWLEEEPLRIRKYIAILVGYMWIISLVLSYILKYFDIDTITLLTVVSGQFSAVVGFYFLSNANSDILNENNKEG